jgi:hypothetical protein
MNRWDWVGGEEVRVEKSIINPFKKMIRTSPFQNRFSKMEIGFFA